MKDELGEYSGRGRRPPHDNDGEECKIDKESWRLERSTDVPVGRRTVVYMGFLALLRRSGYALQQSIA